MNQACPEEATEPELEPACTWTVLPAGERPGITAVVVLVILVFGILVGVIAGDWIWGGLAVVLLLASLSRYFLRSSMRIDRNGIRAEFPLRTREIPWTMVEWVRYDDRSALVRSRKRALLAGREVNLLFGSHGTRVTEALVKHAPGGTLRRADDEGADPCDA